MLASLLMTACSPTPAPVDFGADACAHCQMAIVQQPFAAELVTTKSKVYKFDAIECMVHFMDENRETQFALQLVRDYYNPQDWQDAAQCQYLISEQLPSPMGAFLSAYKDEAGAEKMQAAKGGEVLDWKGVRLAVK